MNRISVTDVLDMARKSMQRTYRIAKNNVCKGLLLPLHALLSTYVHDQWVLFALLRGTDVGVTPADYTFINIQIFLQ